MNKQSPDFAQKSLVFVFRTLRFRAVFISFFAPPVLRLLTVAKRRKFTTSNLVRLSSPSSNHFSRTMSVLRVSPPPSPQWECLLNEIRSSIRGFHRCFTPLAHPRLRSVFPLSLEKPPSPLTRKTGSHTEIVNLFCEIFFAPELLFHHSHFPQAQ